MDSWWWTFRFQTQILEREIFTASRALEIMQYRSEGMVHEAQEDNRFLAATKELCNNNILE